MFGCNSVLKNFRVNRKSLFIQGKSVSSKREGREKRFNSYIQKLTSVNNSINEEDIEVTRMFIWKKENNYTTNRQLKRPVFFKKKGLCQN